jgi:hypothetical protein
MRFIFAILFSFTLLNSVNADIDSEYCRKESAKIDLYCEEFIEHCKDISSCFIIQKKCNFDTSTESGCTAYAACVREVIFKATKKNYEHQNIPREEWAVFDDYCAFEWGLDSESGKYKCTSPKSADLLQVGSALCPGRFFKKDWGYKIREKYYTFNDENFNCQGQKNQTIVFQTICQERTINWVRKCKIKKATEKQHMGFGTCNPLKYKMPQPDIISVAPKKVKETVKRVYSTPCAYGDCKSIKPDLEKFVTPR